MNDKNETPFNLFFDLKIIANRNGEEEEEEEEEEDDDDVISPIP